MKYFKLHEDSFKNVQFLSIGFLFNRVIIIIQKSPSCRKCNYISAMFNKLQDGLPLNTRKVNVAIR